MVVIEVLKADMSKKTGRNRSASVSTFRGFDEKSEKPESPSGESGRLAKLFSSKRRDDVYNMYASVRIGRQIKKTKVIKNTLQPEWNEQFEFKVTEEDKEIVVFVLSSELTGDTTLGTVYLNLDKLRNKNKIEATSYPLGVRMERAKSLRQLQSNDETKDSVDEEEGRRSPPPVHSSDNLMRRISSKTLVSRPSGLFSMLSSNKENLKESAFVLEPVCPSVEAELKEYFGVDPEDLKFATMVTWSPITRGSTEISTSNELRGRLYLTSKFIFFYHSSKTKLKLSYDDILEFDTKKSIKGTIFIIALKFSFAVYGISKQDLTQIMDLLGHLFDSTRSYSLHHAITTQNVAKIEFLLDPAISQPITDFDQSDEDGCLPIHAAIKSNNFRIVSHFLRFYSSNRLDINVKDKFGLTPLHTAFYWCLTGESAGDNIVMALLNCKGVLYDAETNDKATALHIFMQRTRSTNSVEIGELLLHRGSREKISLKNRSGETPLHYAVLNRFVRLLVMDLCLKHGADVNVQSTYSGETPLHYAVRLNRSDCIQLLLKHGASVSIKSSERKSPLELALEENNPETVSCFQHYLDLESNLAEFGMKQYYQTFINHELFINDLVGLPPQFLQSTFKKMGVSISPENMQLLRQRLDSIEKQQKEKERLEQEQKRLAFEQELENKINQASDEGFVQSQDIEGLTRQLTDLTSNLDWKLPFSELEYTKQIGTGASGKIFAGLYRNEKVAIKVFKNNKLDQNQIINDFKREFTILSKLRHSHIIGFKGAALEPQICMVMEMCSNGSLFSYLKGKTGSSLDWKVATRFALDIASAISYLHSLIPSILHRDIKSQNVLIDDGLSCKLIDFGEAIFSNEEKTGMAGTIGWAAPELLNESTIYREPCDIFSLGMTLWEIANTVASGHYQAPYREYQDIKSDIQILTASSERKLRPSLHPSIPSFLSSAIELAWHSDPKERPTAKRLLISLSSK